MPQSIGPFRCFNIECDPVGIGVAVDRQLLATADGGDQRSKTLKSLLRKAAKQTIDGLWQAIGDIFDQFTPKEYRNYLKKAG